MPPEPFISPEDEYEDLPDDGREIPRALDAPIRGDDAPDASDPKQQADLRRRRKFKVNQAIKFWHDGLETAEGRYAIWELLDSLSTFEIRFACGPNGFPQPERTFYDLAEYATGQRILQSLMRHNFAGVHAMLLEHHPQFQKLKPPKKRNQDG